MGSEATLVTVLHADLELVPKPAHTALAVIGFVDVATAADHASALLPLRPLALEGIDGLLIGYQRTKQINARAIAMLPSGGAWLMVQFADDDQARAAQRARAVIDAVSGSTGAVWFDKPEPQAAMEEIREVVLDTGARPPGELRTWPGWEDSAVPPGDSATTCATYTSSRPHTGTARLHCMALRPRLRAYPRRIRSTDSARHPRYAPLRGSRRRPGRLLRRFVLRRTRRRTGPRRSAAEAFRRRGRTGDR